MKRPRGVIVLSLVLLCFGLILLVAAIVAPAPQIPPGVYVGGALYFFVLAWGLIKLRRWAWYATLIAMAIAGVELALTPALTGEATFVPMAVLAVGAIYLLWPGVRAVFLQARQPGSKG